MTIEEIIKKYEQLDPEAKKAVDVLLEKLVTHRTKEANDNSVPLLGALRGKIWISPDFDEPMDEFKEYM